MSRHRVVEFIGAPGDRTAIALLRIPMRTIRLQIMAQSRLFRMAARGWNDPDWLLAGLLVLGVAAVAAALVTQHLFDMQPCPWCILQRVVFLAISVLAGLGLLWRHDTGRFVVGGLGLLLALTGAGCALWQQFYAAVSGSCAITVADRIVSALGLDTRWPDVFLASASCADAAADLLGVPYAFWSLALFVIAGAASVQVLRGSRTTTKSASYRR